MTRIPILIRNLRPFLLSTAFWSLITQARGEEIQKFHSLFPSVTLKILNGIKITPFVGKNIEVVNDTVNGAVMMLKNAIGGVSIVVILIMCITPLINIIVYIFLFEIIAIIIEAIADKRVVNVVKSVSDSTKMLLQSIMTCAFLFIISMALLTV